MIEVLYIAATLIVGLYAGSLLTEAMILVPYWRRMEPAEFFRLHGQLGPKLFQFYAPLTTGAVALAVIAAIANGGENLAWVMTAVICLSALLIFFAYFKKANESFANHSLKDEDLAKELSRWAFWHWLRTILIIIALGSSIAGHAIGLFG